MTSRERYYDSDRSLTWCSCSISASVWCRRTDELVDGPNASHISAVALDRWESRLEDIFAGRPYDMLDAALSDTVASFPVDIQPFRDMIEGMRMDLKKSRYRSFDELYLYCYYVAGTVGLMSVPVMGISPESMAATETVYKGALALGLANQLTNILRDVGEEYVIMHISNIMSASVLAHGYCLQCILTLHACAWIMYRQYITVPEGEGSICRRTSWRWRGSPTPTSWTAASPTSGGAS